jgi:hypothetical protein
MSLLSSLDYDFGMCKPIWKIIDGYFTIPKIKSARRSPHHLSVIEIFFEDDDCTPFQFPLYPTQELFGFAVLQEWKCVFWAEQSRSVYGYGPVSFHMFNLELLEMAMSRWCFTSNVILSPGQITPKILKPEDELKQTEEYGLDDTFNFGKFPSNRKSEILVVVEQGKCVIAYSNWKFGRTDDPSWRDLKPVSV